MAVQRRACQRQYGRKSWAVTRYTWKPGNQGNRADSLTPVYRSTGFPVYQRYFQNS